VSGLTIRCESLTLDKLHELIDTVGRSTGQLFMTEARERELAGLLGAQDDVILGGDGARLTRRRVGVFRLGPLLAYPIERHTNEGTVVLVAQDYTDMPIAWAADFVMGQLVIGDGA
jgi:hypothetical protein